MTVTCLTWPEHLAGYTTHARRGSIRNAFKYGVDYVLIDPKGTAAPGLFSRNKRNLARVDDIDHGGVPRKGRGLPWAEEVFARAGLQADNTQILLLTQPKIFGYVFNPVSFWLACESGELRAVIAEVTNTFGDRHSYLCANPDFAPISGRDRIEARKIFHVSPFQEIAGLYRFTFDIKPERIAIRIAHENGSEGLIATLVGDRKPLSNSGLLLALLRRPFGAMRVIALIHWQALWLKLKGAPYRTRPTPPEQEVSG